jgi:hypothetical protein
MEGSEEDMVNGAKVSEEELMAERVVAASLAILRMHGRFERALGATGRVLQVTRGPFTLRHVTPFARMKGAPARYGVEVWITRRDKVFAAWREPFRVALFVRAPWMNALVPGSYQVPRAGTLMR